MVKTTVPGMEPPFFPCEAANVLTLERLSREQREGSVWSSPYLADALFERLLAQTAAEFKAALREEPAGPFRHLLAYLRSALPRNPRAQQRAQAMAMLVQGDARFGAEWLEFLDLACTADDLDEGAHREFGRLAQSISACLATGATADGEDAIAEFKRRLDIRV